MIESKADLVSPMGETMDTVSIFDAKRKTQQVYKRGVLGYHGN